MNTAEATVATSANVRRRLRKSPFFTVLGLIMLTLAIAGFWPQYFSAVTGRAPDETTQFWLIHLHAVLFIGWLLIYISQATLIMSGLARVHLKLGPWLAGYGFAVAAVGLYAAGLLANRLGEREKDFEAAAAFVFFPVIDMAYFAGFLAANAFSAAYDVTGERNRGLAAGILNMSGGISSGALIYLAGIWKDTIGFAEMLFWMMAAAMLSSVILATTSHRQNKR